MTTLDLFGALCLLWAIGLVFMLGCIFTYTVSTLFFELVLQPLYDKVFKWRNNRR